MRRIQFLLVLVGVAEMDAALGEAVKVPGARRLNWASAQFRACEVGLIAMKEEIVEEMSRRVALSLALVTTATVVATTDALAQATPLHPGEKNSAGVSTKKWGTHSSTIPAYKSVAMADVIYQPGAKSSNPAMPNDMVCHVPQGELRITRRDGTSFMARVGSVWTCRKGQDETVENLGKGVGIMRVIDLLPA